MTPQIIPFDTIQYTDQYWGTGFWAVAAKSIKDGKTYAIYKIADGKITSDTIDTVLTDDNAKIVTNEEAGVTQETMHQWRNMIETTLAICFTYF